MQMCKTMSGNRGGSPLRRAAVAKRRTIKSQQQQLRNTYLDIEAQQQTQYEQSAGSSSSWKWYACMGVVYALIIGLLVAIVVILAVGHGNDSGGGGGGSSAKRDAAARHTYEFTMHDSPGEMTRYSNIPIDSNAALSGYSCCCEVGLNGNKTTTYCTNGKGYISNMGFECILVHSRNGFAELSVYSDKKDMSGSRCRLSWW